MVQETDNVAGFYDNFEQKLLLDFVGGNRRIEQAIQFACCQLLKRDPAAVIDIGSGLGWSSFEFKRCLPGTRVRGVDLSPRLSNLANTVFGGGEGLDYLCADVTSKEWMEGGDAGFQACVMLDVYEHIPKREREGFHESIRRILSKDGVVVLTCPTVMHQDYLRSMNPDGLQPVDEDVTVSDLLLFAKQIRGQLVYYEQKSIWRENDYFHAVLARRNNLPEVRCEKTHPLLSVRNRLRLVEGASPFLRDETMELVRASAAATKQSLLKRVCSKLRGLLGK